MGLFLVGAVPLFYLFLRETIYPFKSNASLAALMKGILSFIPALILDLILGNLVPLPLTPWGMTLNHLYSDILLWLVFGFGGFFLFRIARKPSAGDFLSLLPAFLCGIFMPIPIVELIRNAKWHTLHSLFLAPWMRIAIIATVSLVSAGIVGTARTWGKVIAIGGAAAVLGAFTAGMYLYFANYELYGILCMVIPGLIGIALYLAATRDDHIWEIPLMRPLAGFFSRLGLRLSR